MQELMNLLHQHGLLLVFLVTLASRVGLPLPAAPLIVVAGSLAATGRMSWLGIVLVSVLANVVADWVWYAAGRHYGSRIMRLVCRVSQSPDSCVLESEGLLTRWGGGSLLLAKFIPGVSLVAPPMTGAMRMPFWQFVLYDTVAALLWTLVYLGLGLVFHHQIELVLDAMAQATGVALVLAGDPASGVGHVAAAVQAGYSRAVAARDDDLASVRSHPRMQDALGAPAGAPAAR